MAIDPRDRAVLKRKLEKFNSQAGAFEAEVRDTAAEILRIEHQLAEQERTLAVLKNEIVDRDAEAARWVLERPRAVARIDELNRHIEGRKRRQSALVTSKAPAEVRLHNLRDAVRKLRELLTLESQITAHETGETYHAPVTVDAEKEYARQKTSILDVHVERSHPVSKRNGKAR